MEDLDRQINTRTVEESELFGRIISECINDFFDLSNLELETEPSEAIGLEHEIKSEEQASADGGVETLEWVSLELEAEKEELEDHGDSPDDIEIQENLMPVDVFMLK